MLNQTRFISNNSNRQIQCNSSFSFCATQPNIINFFIICSKNVSIFRYVSNQILINFFFSGTSTSTTDRDAGFCSGGDEDDLEVEDEIHSPTDASEDSVEVKVTPISLHKNKRKCAEPRKVNNEDLPTGPLKKRIRFDTKTEENSPFRPWSIPARPIPVHPEFQSPNYHPVYGYQLPIHQEEPLSLVKSREEISFKNREETKQRSVPELRPKDFTNELRPKDFAKIPKMEPRVPPHPAVRPNVEGEELTQIPKTSPSFSVENLLGKKEKSAEKKEQRNYKNMTRERRIEANARERTRVHTISAAFDTLRRAIPAYSHNQKLSKLSVLRIACSYILTLSRVAGSDYSADQSEPSLASCVDLVSRTIQTEGKLRKKKDD